MGPRLQSHLGPESFITLTLGSSVRVLQGQGAGETSAPSWVDGGSGPVLPGWDFLRVCSRGWATAKRIQENGLWQDSDPGDPKGWQVQGGPGGVRLPLGHGSQWARAVLTLSGHCTCATHSASRRTALCGLCCALDSVKASATEVPPTLPGAPACPAQPACLPCACLGSCHASSKPVASPPGRVGAQQPTPGPCP